VLLAELSPGWQVPELREPYSNDETFRAYFRRNRNRSQVGGALVELPEIAVRLAEVVLDAIVCDEDVAFSRKLIEPMLASLGRRRVQQHLIRVVETGGLLKKGMRGEGVVLVAGHLGVPVAAGSVGSRISAAVSLERAITDNANISGPFTYR